MTSQGELQGLAGPMRVSHSYGNPFEHNVAFAEKGKVEILIISDRVCFTHFKSSDDTVEKFLYHSNSCLRGTGVHGKKISKTSKDV